MFQEWLKPPVWVTWEANWRNKPVKSRPRSVQVKKISYVCHIDGLVQERCALAMELHLSCTERSILGQNWDGTRPSLLSAARLEVEVGVVVVVVVGAALLASVQDCYWYEINTLHSMSVVLHHDFSWLFCRLLRRHLTPMFPWNILTR